MNRDVEDMLRAFVHPSQMDWDTCLPLCECAINNAYQESIKATPFMLNYGWDPPLPDLVALSGNKPIFVQEMHDKLEKSKLYLQAAQSRMS